MDTFRSTTRNPDAPGTGTRTRRWRRWGVVALAALLAHGIAVIWVARAEGDAARFASVQREYAKAPQVT
ncbi:hypothetical protein ACQCQ7_26025, partial [Ralstonia pseudosolanacearum]